MELGKRIKAARLEAGLSQRQLCGERLTRNMLSLIENGSARPSMDTLQYLAGRLGRPVSFFLEEQAVTSPNQTCMAAARACWAERDGEGVLQRLADYRGPDETFDAERGLLEYSALLELARQALESGRLPYAQSLLRRAGACQSPYLADDSARQLLLARAGLPARLDCDETLLLLLAEDALRKDEPERCGSFLQAVQHRDVRWQRLMGLVCFARKRYAEAAGYLSAAEEQWPEDVIGKLEICYRELGDYKKAYEYACKSRR